jgi:hypothetical protein
MSDDVTPSEHAAAATAPAATAQVEAAAAARYVAVVDVLDRDGHVLQTHALAHWPLTIGRALSCTLVLDDPHCAPLHLRIEPDADGRLVASSPPTRNGWKLDGVPQPQQRAVPLHAALGVRELALQVGATRLLLRAAHTPLAPELPLEPPLAGGVPRALAWTGAALLLFAALQAFLIYVSYNPDSANNFVLPRIGGVATSLALWAGNWALASKLFTRQLQFWRHVRIAAFGYVGWWAVQALAQALAFMLDWGFLDTFGNLITIFCGAAVVYAHLRALQPARARAFAWAIGGLALGIGIAGLLVNYQWQQRFAGKLYMTSLLPPAWRLERLAPSVGSARFFEGARRLQPRLDEAARKAGDDDTADDEADGLDD